MKRKRQTRLHPLSREAIEEAIVWLREQQRAADPFYRAIGSAVKRLSDMGVVLTWTDHFTPGKVFHAEYLAPATEQQAIYRIGPSKRGICAQLIYPTTKNLELRGYKVTGRIEYPTYTATMIEFGDIEEVERFIADNAHLAN